MYFHIIYFKLLQTILIRWTGSDDISYIHISIFYKNQLILNGATLIVKNYFEQKIKQRSLFNVKNIALPKGMDIVFYSIEYHLFYHDVFKKDKRHRLENRCFTLLYPNPL